MPRTKSKGSARLQKSDAGKTAMMREVARCPYCRVVSATVDCSVPSFQLAPAICPHVAFLCASLDASRSNGKSDRSRSGTWFWVRGRQRVISGDTSNLCRYVVDLACDLVFEDDCPQSPFRVRGGTALYRDILRPGSGEFPLPPPADSSAMFDAWGLYSRDPQELIREVKQLAGV